MVKLLIGLAAYFTGKAISIGFALLMFWTRGWPFERGPQMSEYLTGGIIVGIIPGSILAMLTIGALYPESLPDRPSGYDMEP